MKRFHRRWGASAKEVESQFTYLSIRKPQHLLDLHVDTADLKKDNEDHVGF